MSQPGMGIVDQLQSAQTMAGAALAQLNRRSAVADFDHEQCLSQEVIEEPAGLCQTNCTSW